MTDGLDAMIAALRESGDALPSDASVALATRLRLRESLGKRRGRKAGVFAGIGILFGATVSWAVATGTLRQLWAPSEHHAFVPAPERAHIVEARPLSLIHI